MSTTSKLSAIIIDCADPARLTEFYRVATGWELTHADADSARLGNGGPIDLGFQRIKGYRGPGWPDDAKHYHLDLTYPNVDEWIHRLLAAGASRPEFQPEGPDWTVLADPEGHLFCVCPE